MSSSGKWIGGIVLALLGMVLVLYNWSNWNVLRGPVSRIVENKTGRQLLIDGDLIMHLRWPNTRINTSHLRFANPQWAEAKDMIDVKNVALSLHLPSLLRGAVFLTEVRLDEANVALEKSLDGRKNWLLDRYQKDENSNVKINTLAVNKGLLTYKDPLQKTDIQADLSTTRNPARPDAALVFKARGKYIGLPLEAQGSGGSLLSLRDQTLAYPIDIRGSIGPTSASAQGHVTSLLTFSTLNLNIDLRGGSLAQLYPLIGVVLPDTPPYKTKGRLIRNANLWRYEKFNGLIGKSDISGTLDVDTNISPRPSLKGNLHSKSLNFADLGPLIGSETTQSPANGPRERILPTSPFRTERWKKMDADVTLKADSIIRNKALPINNLSTHLRMRNAVLTLDPLKFGVAGGTLAGSIRLDGNTSTIQASTNLKANKLHLAQLFPTLESAKTSIGLVNGEFELQGKGNNVANMLGSSNGRFTLVLNEGEISKFLMETSGLHILEMLQIKLGGDRNIKIHCGIADFGVKQGVMQSRTLMLDTDITRLTATGNIDMRTETLDLTLTQKSKKFSLIALRPTIHVRGSLAKPKASVDKTKLASRGLGVVLLGAINPVLALIPLVETGKSQNTECARLINTTPVAARH